MKTRTLVLLLIVVVFSGCVQSPEAKSARYMEAGKKLLQRNDAARAILQFRNAVQATPKNPEVYYQLGTAYLAAGDIHNGVRALRRALELNPKHAAAQLRLAQLMTMVDDPNILKDAQKRIEALLSDTPEDPEALHALAIAEFKLGEREDAMQHLERAMVAAPRELSLAVTLAQVKLQQKDAPGAESVLKKICETSPQSPDALAILGSFYAYEKRTDEAEQQFARALSMKPDHRQALLYLATLQEELGRKQEAEQNFKRLSALPETSSKPAYAMFLFRDGRQEEAIREFEKLARQDPEDRVARTRLVAAYRSANRTKDAEKVLNAALKKNPKDLDALLQRGELFADAGDYTRAEADLNRVLHLRADSAEAHYVMAKLRATQGARLMQRQELTQALQLNPYLLPVRLELAQVLLADSAPSAALDLLNSAPASQRPLLLVQRNWILWTMGNLKEMRSGIDEGLARQRTPDLLIQDGVCKLAQGNPVGARASLEEALEINPADLRAMEALKATYLAQRQPAVAVQKVREYAAREPKSAAVQEFLGLLLWGNGDTVQARAAFTTAKAADPKFVRADLSLVQLDVAEKKWDDAYNKLVAAVRTDEKNARAHLWLGDLEEYRGNHQAAIDQFRKAVQLDSQSADALNNLAYLLTESGGQLDEALKYAERALELAPGNLYYADTLGWIQFRKGLYPSAIKNLERATAKEDGSAVWKYHLAMAYLKAGDLQRGRATLQTALKRNPNLPEAAAAKQLLDTVK